MPVKMWQKLERIEFLAKEQFHQQNGINDKLTVLKKKQAATVTLPKPQTWAAMAANAKLRFPLFNKTNEIVVKLNDGVSAKMMKNQALEEVADKIDAYLIENNITITKLRAARTLLSGDIAIQTTNEEESERLKGKHGWTKVLGSKVKLARKPYRIVVLGIFIAKIDLEKVEETKEKIIMQNASICTRIKIKSIFWLSALKKDKRTSSLVIEVDDAKMVNTLIEEGLVLDHTLHRCMKYNLACKIKQCFHCDEYGHVSVYCQKNTKCIAYSCPHRKLECP